MSPPVSPGLFHLAPDALTFAGAGDRFAKNLAALQLVHDLESQGRSATDAERLALAHYSAFGESALLNRLFRYDSAAGRYVLHDTYTAFLSAADARRLRQAALTAFYTSLDMIHVIWQAVLRLGLGDLDRPRIIEPAAGVGHFVSAMPPELRARAAITAVELDPVTSRILCHIHSDLTSTARSALRRSSCRATASTWRSPTCPSASWPSTTRPCPLRCAARSTTTSSPRPCASSAPAA